MENRIYQIAKFIKKAYNLIRKTCLENGPDCETCPLKMGDEPCLLEHFDNVRGYLFQLLVKLKRKEQENKNEG